MTARQPWRAFPERWNRQTIYRFPNDRGASVIAEVDWETHTPGNGQPLPRRDDVVEIGLITFHGDKWALARDADDEQTIWREVPLNDIDGILDEIEAMPPTEAASSTACRLKDQP